MAVPRGRAVYKKKDGIIAVSDDRTAVVWSPMPGSGPPALSLNINSIANLQQTPDTAAKVMLKIFAKAPTEEGEPVAHLFHFTSPDDARSEANAIKEILSRLLAEARSNDPSLPMPAGASTPAVNGNSGGGVEGSGSAAMTFASTVNSRPKPPSARWFDDAQLKLDIELQQSLMKRDRNLHQTYMEARAGKPESMSDGAFNSQFWSSRTDLLRAHAIETSQKKGLYNVFSKVEIILGDPPQVNLTHEQTELILAQHPLVRRLYNELVPKVFPTRKEFFRRFFLSQLSEKMMGKRDGNNSHDQVFDKYDVTDDVVESRVSLQRVPHVIDLQANDENRGGFKGGNRPDQQMRSDPSRAVAKALNNISESIMSQVSPADRDPSTMAAMDELTFQGLALRDLYGDAEPDRIVLNVKEQARFFNQHHQSSAASADAEAYEKQDPDRVLADFRADIATLREVEEVGSGGIDLQAAIGIDDESDSEDESRKRSPHVGSREARMAAQAQVWEGLAKRRGEAYDQQQTAESGGIEASLILGGSSTTTATGPGPLGLPPDIMQKTYITNATTTEFLKQFWAAFLSGDPDRAQELAYHVEALKNSFRRIYAVADEAEEARQKEIERKREEVYAYWRKTKKKLKWSEDKVGGGKKGVLTVLGPTLNALETARDRYQDALAAEGIKPSTEE